MNHLRKANLETTFSEILFGKTGVQVLCDNVSRRKILFDRLLDMYENSKLSFRTSDSIRCFINCKKHHTGKSEDLACKSHKTGVSGLCDIFRTRNCSILDPELYTRESRWPTPLSLVIAIYRKRRRVHYRISPGYESQFL